MADEKSTQSLPSILPPHVVLWSSLFFLTGLIGLYWCYASGATGRSFWAGLVSMFGFLGSGVMAVLLVAALHRTKILPGKELADTVDNLAYQDLKALATAIMDLGQGNLSVHVAVQSKPVPMPEEPGFRPLAGSVNAMIQYLGSAVNEFNEITDAPCLRLCYIGADSFLEGQRCGEAIGEALKGQGKIAIITGTYVAPGLELRRKGFLDVLFKRYSAIEVIDAGESRENPDLAYACMKQALHRHPEITGVYATEGIGVPGVVRAVAEAGRQGQVKIITHDFMDHVMAGIQGGSIYATLGQEPFVQGHDPAVCLFNHLVANWRPPQTRMLTRLDLVTRENFHQFWHPQRGLLQSEEMLNRLTKPLKPSPKPIRIAVLSAGCDGSVFWESHVKQGAMAAKAVLEPMNAEVEWVIPPDRSAEAFGETVIALVTKGVQGIASPVFDTNVITYFNKAARAGVPVVTFNSEPFSIRSLVATITDQAEHLMGHSQNLAASTYQVSMATGQIKNTMAVMAEGTSSQTAQINQTQSTLNELLDNIDRINRQAEAGAAATEQTARAVADGAAALEQTLSAMKGIEQSVGGTWQTVEALATHSRQIDEVAELIQDIASRVNVLALNAQIEATRAGEAGRGFKIVANEIRTLSKNTGAASRKVMDLIALVQTDADKVGKAMHDGLAKIQESERLTHGTGESLNRIRSAFEGDKARLQEIATEIKGMQKFSHQVGTAMGNVSRISEKNMQAAEEVNASTEEMTAQLEDVADLAQSLETMAKGEQQLLAKFRV